MSPVALVSCDRVGVGRLLARLQLQTRVARAVASFLATLAENRCAFGPRQLFATSPAVCAAA